MVLASCEDKDSSKENRANSQTDTTEKQEPEFRYSTKQEDKELDQDRPPGPLIEQEELIPFLTEYGKVNPEDRIRISSRFGDIEVQLFHDTPLHRAHFIFLVKNDYFDGTFFHRVSENFVVQGGNSDNASTNRKRHYIGDYLVPGEFDAGHRHVRGTFGAAKYSEQNVSKASSPYEFYIVQSERGAPHLDNDHTVFGRVTKGMDVVDEISQVETDSQEWPLRNIVINVEIID